MLSEEYPLMFDYMINHISAHSPYYQDFLENKDQSPYRGLFIRYKDFWKNGMPTQAETDAIYKRKPRAPYLWQSLGIRPRRQSGVPLERNRSTLTWRQRKESAFGRKSSLAGQTRCIAYPPGRFCLCCETTGNFLLFCRTGYLGIAT